MRSGVRNWRGICREFETHSSVIAGWRHPMDGDPRVRQLLEELLDSEQYARRGVPRLPRVAAAGPRALAAKTRLRRPTGCDVPGAGVQLAIRRPIVDAVLGRSAPDPGS